MLQTIAKVVAVLAIIGLVASSFALGVGAQTNASANASTNAGVNASPNASFNRNLTVGNRGAEVTALQDFLISRGFTIPAGPTGYFGGQTQAALARYQASVKIHPAAGYFGPITRAQVHSIIEGPATPDADDDEAEDDEDEEDIEAEARAAFEEAEDAIAEARDAIEEAEDEGADIDDEIDELLEDAEVRLGEAQAAFDDEEYELSLELLEEVNELLEEALEAIEEAEEDEEEEAKVTTSAEVDRNDGADNDLAIFEIDLPLTSFNQDSFVDQDPDVSFEYEVRDSGGNEVTSYTQLAAVLESTAEEEGDYYVVDEDGKERFTLTVYFDPLAGDEGQLFRLQLLGINYADTEAAPEDTWDARPAADYRTDAVFIAD